MSFDNTETEAEALAANVLTIDDLRRMDATGLSADEFLREEHGVDPSDHDSESELRAAVLSARKLNGDPDHKGSEHSNITGDTDTESETTLTASTGVDRREYGDSDTEIEALAESTMSVAEWREMDAEGLSAREFVAERHGVDPDEYRTEAGLQQAIDQEAER